MKGIILAGGTGSRLRPVSTKESPKQFLKLFGEDTLLETTIKRISGYISSKDIYISTTELYEDRIKDIADRYDLGGVIVEPCKRNTAGAIACIINYLMAQTNYQETESLVFLPADHLIRPVDSFHAALDVADASAKNGNIIVFGVTPTHPETGYGYIQVGESHGSVSRVKSFKEKPSRELAKSYLEDGHYYRNSGMFVFSGSTILEEYITHTPDIGNRLTWNCETFNNNYDTIPDMPFDVAIMEKTKKAMIVPISLQWNDIGYWDSIYGISEKDDNGNVIKGKVTIDNVQNSLIRNETSTEIKMQSIENVILIKTHEGLYQTSRGSSQKIKILL